MPRIGTFKFYVSDKSLLAQIAFIVGIACVYTLMQP